jgi:hypothetical protein
LFETFPYNLSTFKFNMPLFWLWCSRYRIHQIKNILFLSIKIFEIFNHYSSLDIFFPSIFIFSWINPEGRISYLPRIKIENHINLFSFSFLFLIVRRENLRSLLQIKNFNNNCQISFLLYNSSLMGDLNIIIYLQSFKLRQQN